MDLPTDLLGAKQVDKARVSGWVQLDHAIQPSLQVEELLWAEEICRADERIIKAAREVGVEPENLYVDGWCIGIDDRFPNKRLQQCFLFTRNRPEDNLYSHPLDFIPVIGAFPG